jgi:cytoskeletal protein RodZ
MISVGEIFKQSREKKGLTIQDVEKEIRVRSIFLKAVEENDWSVFSSKIYIDGIITSYAKLLGLDSKKILAFFRREYEKTEEVKFKERIANRYLTPETKKAAIFGLSLIFIVFFSYFIYQLKIYFSPPKLIIVQPTTTVFKHEDRVKIVGETEKEATVNILGERVYQNSEGIFEFNLPLKLGKNELVIEAIGANGRKSILKKSFVRE